MGQEAVVVRLNAISNQIDLLLFFFSFPSKERKRLSKLPQNSVVNGPLEV